MYIGALTLRFIYRTAFRVAAPGTTSSESISDAKTMLTSSQKARETSATINNVRIDSEMKDESMTSSHTSTDVRSSKASSTAIATATMAVPDDSERAIEAPRTSAPVSNSSTTAKTTKEVSGMQPHVMALLAGAIVLVLTSLIGLCVWCARRTRTPTQAYSKKRNLDARRTFPLIALLVSS